MNQAPEIFPAKPNLPDSVVHIDAYTSSLKEIFHVRNPQWKQGVEGYAAALSDFLANIQVPRIWIYYPWQALCVETVEENAYYELLTARNKLVITSAEQDAYRKLQIGIIGLSIGSNVTQAFAITGGPKRQKIADFDTIEITNLNRMRAGLVDVGMNKTMIAARNAWAVDPFIHFELWDKGVQSDTLERFITEPKLDVFIDEMDSLDLKIRSRLLCKRHRIPVFMATDNGDSILLDIERFDLEPERPIFHGAITEPNPEDLAGLSYRDWLKLASQIVGAQYLTERMQQSLLAIGAQIASVPQLGTTANVAAAGITVACRRLAAKLPLESGRYTLGFEEILIPEYNSKASLLHRQQLTQEFIQSFESKFR